MKNVASRSRSISLASALAVTIACAAPASSASTLRDSALCDTAISEAAARTGAPIELLRAIATVESGRGGHPWPWALHAQGRGHWHATETALHAHIAQLRATGETNFDIGCFQINAHWHGTAFDTLESITDPWANSLYAAQFLARLRQEFGTWEQAAGAFHSRTPERADAYRHRVLARLNLAQEENPHARPPAPPPAPARQSVSAYPLLVTGQAGALGSTVPTQVARRPFLAGWKE